MAFFDYSDGRLHVESVAADRIAEQLQTPVYCYSAAAIRHNYRAYTKQFNAQHALICYAVKANSNQAIISLLGQLGAGADVVSEGELRRVLLAGIPANKIVYSGVAKTATEMRFALQQDILQFNVESEQELEVLNQVALAAGKQAPVAFRINPDIDAGMNDLLRPSMYDAFHEILPVRPSGADKHSYQIVGPICETGDTFARDRELPIMKNGDLVAIMNSGAYGAVMASTYNTRPLVPEVLVDGENFAVIRKRPDYEDMINLDTAE